MDSNKLAKKTFEILCERLAETIEPRYLTPGLISEGVLSIDEQEDILQHGTRQKRALTLITILSPKGVKALQALAVVLNSHNDSDLARKIIETYKNEKLEMENKKELLDLEDNQGTQTRGLRSESFDLINQLSTEDLEEELKSNLLPFNMAQHMKLDEVVNPLIQMGGLTITDLDDLKIEHKEAKMVKQRAVTKFLRGEKGGCSLREFVEDYNKFNPNCENFKKAILEYVEKTKRETSQ